MCENVTGPVDHSTRRPVSLFTREGTIAQIKKDFPHHENTEISFLCDGCININTCPDAWDNYNSTGEGIASGGICLALK